MSNVVTHTGMKCAFCSAPVFHLAERGWVHLPPWGEHEEPLRPIQDEAEPGEPNRSVVGSYTLKYVTAVYVNVEVDEELNVEVTSVHVDDERAEFDYFAEAPETAETADQMWVKNEVDHECEWPGWEFGW